MTSPNTKRNVDKSSNDLYNTPLDALEAAWVADIFDAHDVIMTPVMVLELSLTSLNLRGRL